MSTENVGVYTSNTEISVAFLASKAHSVRPRHPKKMPEN
jgi:hypothetical protein